jgi:hypothetical protein
VTLPTSIAPVAAMTSETAHFSCVLDDQSIAWSGPAMKPSTDIALFTTTVPRPVSGSLMPVDNPARGTNSPASTDQSSDRCDRTERDDVAHCSIVVVLIAQIRLAGGHGAGRYATGSTHGEGRAAPGQWMDAYSYALLADEWRRHHP